MYKIVHNMEKVEITFLCSFCHNIWIEVFSGNQVWGDLVLPNGFLEYTVYSENIEFITVKYGDDNVHVFLNSLEEFMLSVATRGVQSVIKYQSFNAGQTLLCC